MAAKKVQSAGLDLRAKRALMAPSADGPSIRRQGELIGFNRASWYAQARPASESEATLVRMRRLDQSYPADPFYGSRKMTAVLPREDFTVTRKRGQRLMRLRGLQSVAPQPNTSRAHPEHQVYPYLLREVVVERPNQVWATDITDIRIARGFAYLVAVLDWHSRLVLAWRLSNSLDTEFWVQALNQALERYGQPERFNTDQGSQFPSLEFTGVLHTHGVRISMDGKGRALDNIFVERLWRSVKYEEVYLKHYETMREAPEGLTAYFRFSNTQRPHQALGNRPPAGVYEAVGALIPAAAGSRSTFTTVASTLNCPVRGLNNGVQGGALFAHLHQLLEKLT